MIESHPHFQPGDLIQLKLDQGNGLAYIDEAYIVSRQPKTEIPFRIASVDMTYVYLAGGEDIPWSKRRFEKLATLPAESKAKDQPPVDQFARWFAEEV